MIYDLVFGVDSKLNAKLLTSDNDFIHLNDVFLDLEE